MFMESITHQGLIRENNEDRILTRSFQGGGALLAIADGMGGHAAGEVAAQLALECLENLQPDAGNASEALQRSVQEAQEVVLAASRMGVDLKGMGTTLTVALVYPGVVRWAHIGDTRLYLFSAGELVQITDDHTIPGLLFLNGEISKEQARLHPYGNILLQCIGCDKFSPDSGTFEIREGDMLLLSSDGLHDLISDEEIASVLSTRCGLGAMLDRLVAMCLERGGKDNISAIVARM